MITYMYSFLHVKVNHGLGKMTIRLSFARQPSPLYQNFVLLEAASQHLWTRKKQKNEDRIFIYDSLPLLLRKMVIEYKIVRVKKASTLVEEMWMEWLWLSTFEELGMGRLQKLQNLRAEYKCTYEAMWQCREGTLNAFETLKVQCMESNVILSGRVWGILTKNILDKR